jgi:hypothetical protein
MGLETAVTSRASEPSLGKIPTTLVRRLISPLTRSREFVDQAFAPVGLREVREGEEVFGGVVEHGGDVGEAVLEHANDLTELGRTWCSSG